MLISIKVIFMIEHIIMCLRFFIFAFFNKTENAYSFVERNCGGIWTHLNVVCIQDKGVKEFNFRIHRAFARSFSYEPLPMFNS